MRFKALFAFFLGALSLSAAENKLVLPKLSCSGKPDSVLSADVPWRTNFTRTQVGTPAQAQTRVKLFHDGKYLYVGAEALEPEMNKIVDTEQNARGTIWRNDTLEINFDPNGDNLALGKIFVDASGRVADYFGLDDNQGKDQFTVEPCRSSGTRVVSARKLADRWTVELAVPIGIFFDGTVKKSFAPRLNIARNRYAGNMENSDLFPVPANGHGKPRFFPTLVLEKFDPAEYAYRIEGATVKCEKLGDKLHAAVTGKVVNPGKRFRNLKATVRLLDARGQVLDAKSAGVAAQPGKLTDFKVRLAPEKLGRCKLEIQLADLTGAMFCNQVSSMELSWSPIAIKVLEPAYRNNIYATMPALKSVKAEIALTENIGAPLTATLTGPDYSESVTIPAAQAVNAVEFPFENAKEGTYTLKAGEVSAEIKKLPRHPGEVWLDKDGIVCIDGRKFLPFGGYGAPATWHPRGVNMEHTTAIWSSKKQLTDYLDKMHENGIKTVIYPYFDPNKEQAFGNAARTAGKLSDRQKELLRESVAIMREHPAMLAYYVADEPEGWGHNEEWYVDLRKFLAELDPYHPVTITNYGTDGQRRFHRGCDILFADTYPNYYEDNTTALGRRCNFEYVSHASRLRPAWQMIQSFDWGKPSAKGVPGRAPTFDELREQIYTAALANSKGFMFYSFITWGTYSSELFIGREYLGAELDSLKELLLAPTENTVKASGSFAAADLLCGMKRAGGQALIIAVNLSEKPVQAAFTSSVELEDSLAVAGEKRSVALSGKKSFQDSLPPHVVRLYVTSGAERDAVDLGAVRETIRKAHLARHKEGNLAFAGELPVYWMKEYKKGRYPGKIPVITVSSSIAVHLPDEAKQYFLQDGVRRTAACQVMTWTPTMEDKEPWAEIDFGKEAVIDRTVLYMVKSPDFGMIRDGRIQIPEGDGYRTVAEFKNNDEEALEIKFAPVKTRKLRLRIDRDEKRWKRLLHEWEVYGPETKTVPKSEI